MHDEEGHKVVFPWLAADMDLWPKITDERYLQGNNFFREPFYQLILAMYRTVLCLYN